VSTVLPIKTQNHLTLKIYTIFTCNITLEGDSISDMCDILTIFLKIIQYNFYLVHFWNFILVSVGNSICFGKKIATWDFLIWKNV